MNAVRLIIQTLVIFSGVTGIFIFLYNRKGKDRNDSESEVDTRSGSREILDERPKKFHLQKYLNLSKAHPNYFVSGGISGQDTTPLRDTSLVFVHHPRTGGQKVIDCLSNISYSHNLPMSPLMTSENRYLWDTGNSNVQKYRSKLKIHRGRFSFGMCENLDNKCSYVMLLRDPLKRAISSHKHCQNNPRSDICGSRDANEVSLRDWILDQKNVLLKQFLISPELCRNDMLSNYNFTIDLNKHLSCWTKSNLLLDTIIENADKLARHIIQNLHKLIAVIGLSEELKLSMRMLESSFKLPFSKCNIDNLDEIRSKREINSNRAINTNGARNSRVYDEFSSDSEDIEFENDEEIKAALSNDYAIYKEAKRLFHIQKQVLLNSVR